MALPLRPGVVDTPIAEPQDDYSIVEPDVTKVNRPFRKLELAGYFDTVSPELAVFRDDMK